MNNYQVIVCDLDGTLLPKSQIISQKTIDYFHKLQSLDKHIVIATGRSVTGLRDIVNQVCIKAKRSFLVTCNGQSILDFRNNNFYEGERVSQKDSLDLVTLAKKHHLIIYIDNDVNVYKTAKYLGIVHGLDFFIKYFKRAKWILQQVKDTSKATSIKDHIDKDIRKLCFVGSRSYLERFVTNVKEIYGDKFNCLMVSNNWLEILMPSNSKGKAIELISKELNIPLDQFICFGDGENDIEMLENAGLGVAMGNALDSVKEASDDVTLTNEEDGVYHYLYKIFK